MSDLRPSYFSLLLEKAGNPAGICTSLLLALMAQADGLLTTEERKILASSADRIMPGMDEGRKAAILDELVAIASGNRIDDLVLACMTLRRHATPADRDLIVDLLVGMIVSDNRVNLAERYILEFITDLLGLTPDELNAAYKNNIGREMPFKGDPSSRAWWEVSWQRQQRHEAASPKTGRTAPATNEEACGVLGLHAGASPEEIRSAYRRLAMRHHPDRFQALGEEAVQRAHLTFLHIKEAYEMLGVS